MTSTEPRPVLAEPRPTGTVAAVTALYIVVTMTSLAVAFLTSFASIRLLGTLLALVGQLVFLVPVLRGHLPAVAVWVTAAFSIAASGLFFAYLGSYFLAGLATQQLGSLEALLWATAAYVATCSSHLLLVVGTILLGLAVSTPVRWTTLAGVGIGATTLVAAAESAAFMLAP